MIPELGHFSLILATVVALLLGTLPLIGAHRGQAAWVALARPAACAFALLVALVTIGWSRDRGRQQAAVALVQAMGGGWQAPWGVAAS